MGKSCKELQEGGYDAFINNYYCFDKDILNKREKLVTKGEEFTTKVLFKNRNGDYEKYLVTNKVFIRDEYNQPVLFLGESISLENLFDNDSEINEMYSKDRVYRHLNFVKQFSERQREVLYLVFYEGLSDQEIADKLHISLDTVCSHKKDIKNKIKVSSNTQFNKILRKNLLPELN
ncbi:MAG: LuxR family transcriptional regulator [Bacteroidales bacterium]|nr:LuxR family transcriptional regulator [Bacteroidales bacterium]